MRLRRPSALLSPVVFFPLTSAMSLSDWKPESMNLPSTCNAIYRRQIPDCTLSDFSGSCSSSCIDSLLSLNTDILTSCSISDVEPSSLVAQFLRGKGLSTMCPGIVVVTVIPSPGATGDVVSPSTTTTLVSTTLFKTSTTTIKSKTPSTSPPSTTTTLVSTTLFETSTTTIRNKASSTSPASSTFTAQDTGTPSAHHHSGGDTDSGGGSPFDIYAINTSGVHRVAAASSSYLALAAAVVLVFTI